MPRLDMLTGTVPNTPKEFADTIPVADAAGHWNRHGRRPPKRNRRWEKLHRPYRYVNVPIELREQVLALAEHLAVTADEVARAFFEYGIECVDADILQLHAQPNPLGRKMTLFPKGQPKGWRETVDHQKQIPARKKKRIASTKKIYPAVSYRLPEIVHDSLCGLAMDLDVPLGEVVTFLLRYGLDAYRAGRLSLNPEPLTVKMTLRMNGFQPDVILLDVMMPDMNGFEVCQSIRSTDSLHEVPIIIVTSLDDRKSRLKGLDAGADDFITKPFDGIELVTRLQGMARLNRYRIIAGQRRELEQLNADILVAYDRTIEGWSRALDLRDKETEGHTGRVTEKNLLLARAYGMSEQDLTHIRRGALLHDVGKLVIPDSILLKPGKLSDEEWTIMKQHPGYAYEWLSPIPYLCPALDIPYCHHEKWDGSGYPRGLKGEEIPVSARLFAIIDVWDAITSDRPYRMALAREEALQYILSQSGLYFDPASCTALHITYR